MNKTVHMLWVYGNLSKLQRISASSFIHHGFEVNIWSYNDNINVPKGAKVCNAREILSESRIFKYENGSYAGFSNLFRYAVLSKIGGLWADMDVICNMQVENLGVKPFLVSQRNYGAGVSVNNNVIYNPNPTNNDMIALAYAFANSFPVDKLKWGDCGPKLFSVLTKFYPQIAFQALKPNFANPFSSWDCPKVLLEPNIGIPPETKFIHCYAEMWNKAGIPTDISYPPGSIMARMEEKYHQKLALIR